MTQNIYGVEEVKCDVCGKTEKVRFSIDNPQETSSLESDLEEFGGWKINENGFNHVCSICHEIKEKGWEEEYVNEHESAEWINNDNPDYLLKIDREYPIAREAEFFTERDENGNMVEKEKYHIICRADDFEEIIWGWDSALSRAREFMSINPS